MVMVRNGQEQRLGSYEVVVEDRPDAIVVIQRTVIPQGEILDSAWVDPRTFDPRRSVSRGIAGSSDISFRGRALSGRRRTPSGDDVAITDQLEEPHFLASLAQLMVRALPLADGLRVTLPLFQDPGGATTGQVEVLGKVAVPGEDGAMAWKVSLELGRAKAVVWIDAGTLRERRTEAEMPGGATMVMRPLRPGS
jgi:hypothetical protein